MEWNPTTHGFRHPLAVWVVWHPPTTKVDPEAQQADAVWRLADTLRRKLGGEWHSEGDRQPRPTGSLADLPSVEAEIPLFFYRSTDPRALELDRAIRSQPAERVVVLLILDPLLKSNAGVWERTVDWLHDNHMVHSDADRDEPRSETRPAVAGRRPRAFSLLPVETAEGDHNVFPKVSKLVTAKWHTAAQEPQLYVDLLRHLCEQFASLDPPLVFISYTRADARAAADVVFKLLERTPGLSPWRDDKKILAGHHIRERIEADLPRSFYLPILSPGFVRGRWTLREAALARAHDRPTAVVDVLEGTLRRLPPELGNAPVLRWPPRSRAARREILAALVFAELLRHRVHAARVRILAAATRHGGPLDACVSPPGRQGAAAPGAIRVYADPPLLEEELRLQTRGSAGRFLTATQFAAEAGWPEREGRPNSVRVGLSASPPEDATLRGLYDPQMNDLSVSLARTLICLGLRLVYGGDLRPGGLTNHLVRVARQYGPHRESSDSLRAFMSWPFSESIPKDTRQEFERDVRLVCTPGPSDLGPLPEVKHPFADVKKSEVRLAASVALFRMREALVRASDARVALGGRSTGAVGRLPGVVEELWLSIRARQPVYLAAGLGGATREVYTCITTGDAPKLTLAAQVAAEPLYRAVYDGLPANARFSYDELRDELKALGAGGLSDLNGLTEHENEALAEAKNATEIIYWVSRGLGRVFGGPDAVLRLRDQVDRLLAVVRGTRGAGPP